MSPETILLQQLNFLNRIDWNVFGELVRSEPIFHEGGAGIWLRARNQGLFNSDATVNNPNQTFVMQFASALNETMYGPTRTYSMIFSDKASDNKFYGANLYKRREINLVAGVDLSLPNTISVCDTRMATMQLDPGDPCSPMLGIASSWNSVQGYGYLGNLTIWDIQGTQLDLQYCGGNTFNVNNAGSWRASKQFTCGYHLMCDNNMIATRDDSLFSTQFWGLHKPVYVL